MKYLVSGGSRIVLRGKRYMGRTPGVWGVWNVPKGKGGSRGNTVSFDTILRLNYKVY